MRFESVTAHAFGPFRGEVLRFAPGMNVVFGENEAGKSTWHAAVYAGLCGMRRGRGQPRVEDRAFGSRHRPWEGNGGWDVGAVIALEDGRRVELRHDLAGRVDSSARDASVAGRDYSHAIINDGAPDGAKFLGLDRRSFLTTACVRQADILGVLGDAVSLQDDLQRAAATAGGNATAAEALARLREYQNQYVGTDRAWTKPLQTARDDVAAKRGEAEQARAAHSEYLGREVGVDALERALREAESQAIAARAVLTEYEAAGMERRLTRAREIEASFPDGAPTRPAQDDALSRGVAAALEAWRSRPVPEAPAGATVDALRGQLEALEREPLPAPALPQPAPRRTAPSWVLAAAILSAVLGAAFTAIGVPVAGIPLLICAIALVGWRLAARRARSAVSHVLVPAAADPLREERRRSIEHLIDDRMVEERRYEAEQARFEAVASQVAAAATGAGLDAGEPVSQVEALYEWQRRREAALAEAGQRQGDWEELQRLLGERTVQELAAEVDRLWGDAKMLASTADPTWLAAAREEHPRAGQLDEIEARVAEARQQWHTARGELAEFSLRVPSVSDAEDSLAAARAELDRVERLDGTLRMTIAFLERAEERVHRDIAPVLRDTVLEWLPLVTRGRYTDCRVDPQTLAVEVCGAGGRWRSADLLSHGTAEQVYLLLRVALARHLTQRGEICPLVLDDVVAACDAGRKQEVLEMLLALSESLQVILFTHEDDVRVWAHERLSGPRHHVQELDGAAAPA